MCMEDYRIERQFVSRATILPFSGATVTIRGDRNRVGIRISGTAATSAILQTTVNGSLVTVAQTQSNEISVFVPIREIGQLICEEFQASSFGGDDCLLVETLLMEQ